MTSIARLAAAAALALAAGCTSNPMRVVEVHQPVTVRPSPPTVAAAAPANGAIFQPQAISHVRYVPLFEDPRARNVGDTLTVQINEKLNAQKSAQSAADRKGGMSFVVPEIQLGTRSYPGGKIQADSKNAFEGSGDSAANNLFTGTIAVTVIDVLPNGNLLVAGEKQIGINQGSEFVRLSGVVNPRFILAGNIVSSTTIADARLEYRGTGYIDEAQTMGWLSRVFMSVMPF
ncbi:MAG: flagellar basal body L-ring protein FlgH [Burkholderiales bacterium]|nr:flagellar basal body L-ring protein FlgH [Burkholderiales bacterium]GIK86627.1 MAG: flagellar L-ring protein [Betaproteobacteria bacterium]